ncbi:MAG TPA: heterodisulfide reductase-related iron-sulfur binding cluster [Actinomycetota bacterium]|jgi:glycolate oxidase iron-sulfur subunit|nr:heterodisulfide reductase-related iron-sulfur binding cluster [Actinomycetota bacterium]
MADRSGHLDLSAGRAFDAHRPPSKELIEDCVHCGFCLPTCPTYVLWGEEMDSPRGRIVLMNQGLQDGPMSGPMVEHFDRCLGCMACVTACPSGVQYNRLIEATRPQVERNHDRSRSERAFRRAIFGLFTHPGRMRAAVPALVAAQRLRLDRLVPKRMARLRAMTTLAPKTSMRSMRTRLQTTTPAVGAARGARVGLLQGCIQRVFFGDVNDATRRVLAAEGYEVVARSEPRCCGALMMHAGEEPGAIRLAKQTIEAFDDCDLVAVNAAGCGSAMKDYRFLLDDDKAWSRRAEEFSEKVKDVNELLAEHEPRAERRALRMRVAYHDACHLAHAQGIRSQPRQLLRGIPELEVLEPEGWEICCGSAGVYNLLQPEAADDLGRRKAANLLATGADAIVAANPGCTLQIAAKLKEAGRPLPVYHPMELLARSIDTGGVG